jgi:hypothetical protein
MFDNVLTEFDHNHMILHVSGKTTIMVKTEAELEMFCQFVRETMEANCGGGPGYMIVDMSRVLIDPSLAHVYAEHVRNLIGRYIHTNGIARYGYEITRLTARQGYLEIADEDPNIFATRAEAHAFIMSLIERNSRSRASTSA